MPSTRFSRKRGRPRSSPASGLDRGTPELQHKRISGTTDELLDRLHRAGRLTDDELRNAQLFQRLYTIRMGNPLPLALDPSRVSTGISAQRDRSQEERQYRTTSLALERAGLLTALINAVMFGRLGKEELHLRRLKQALRLFGQEMRNNRAQGAITDCL